MKKTFRVFRKTALAEGVSFIVLLFIAMPLKYLANYPLAVSIVGAVHGFLFVGFLVLAYLVKDGFKKNWFWMGKAVLASILPFGTFIMDKQWKEEENHD